MEDSGDASEPVLSQTSEGVSVQDGTEASREKTIENVCIYFDEIQVNGINNIIIILMISYNKYFKNLLSISVVTGQVTVATGHATVTTLIEKTLENVSYFDLFLFKYLKII